MHFIYPALLVAFLSSPLLVVAVPNLANKYISDDYAARLANMLEQPGVSFDAHAYAAQEAERVSSDLVQRADPGENVAAVLTNSGTLPTNQMPECTDDPSYAKRGDRKYKVDQGIRVAKKGNDDPCTKGTGNDKCWSEQWWVESEIVMAAWQPANIVVDCAKTSSCSTTVVELGQTCNSITTTTENGFEMGLEVKAEFLSSYTVGTNPKYSFKKGEGKTKQVCSSESGRAQCSFDDQGCHAVFQSQRSLRVYGYVARVCNSAGNLKNVQRSEKNAKGHYVRGILEFSFDLPVNKAAGCGGSCYDAKYTAPLPPSGGQGLTQLTALP